MKFSGILYKLIAVIVFLFYHDGSFNLPASNDYGDISFNSKIPKIPFYIRVDIGNNSLLRINPTLYVKDTKMEVALNDKILSYKIMANGKMHWADLVNFLLDQNSKIDMDYAKNLASLYVQESKIEGVNHDIAFSQMCLETGFLNFGGVVQPYQNNFCGLGAINKKVSGEKFNSLREGVRAHIQHLKAYASKNPINNTLIDNRFLFVKRGTATIVDDLSGKWASDPEYGNKIKSILKRLQNV